MQIFENVSFKPPYKIKILWTKKTSLLKKNAFLLYRSKQFRFKREMDKKRTNAVRCILNSQ